MGRTRSDQGMFGDCSLKGTLSFDVFPFLRNFYFVRYKLDDMCVCPSKNLNGITKKGRRMFGLKSA
jgi:hypothetical protein